MALEVEARDQFQHLLDWNCETAQSLHAVERGSLKGLLALRRVVGRGTGKASTVSPPPKHLGRGGTVSAQAVIVLFGLRD